MLAGNWRNVLESFWKVYTHGAICRLYSVSTQTTYESDLIRYQLRDPSPSVKIERNNVAMTIKHH
jgi:hypothetical protein